MSAQFGEERPLVLIVDADEINQLTVEQILDGGVEIVQKHSGSEAMEFLEKTTVDLALLDQNLPDMTGLDVLKSMKQREEMWNVPVIIMTGDVDMELETEVFRTGAVDFIRKPFVPMALQERVSRVLQNEYLQRNLRKEANRQARLAEERLAASQRLFDETVLALARTIDAKDKYTQGHSQRVAEYARRIAQRSGLDSQRQREIFCIALLHDIGKIGVPNAILNKTSRLTDEEYDVIKSHTTIGANILKSIMEFPKLSMGARSHHERWDGRGYPDGLLETEIPKEARIIAVADAYDAMTSKRSYRDVMAQERVRREIERGRGTQFDPQFADVMLDMMDEDVDFKMRAEEPKNDRSMEE